MESTFDPYSKKHASVYANDEFVCVQSSVGYRSTVGDKIIEYLPSSATESEIGKAVLSALSSYRVLSLSEVGEFFDLARVQEKHAEWEKELVTRASYKSTKQVYRNLRLVSVRLSESKLSASATTKDRRNGFAGNGFSVTLDVGEGESAVGSAILKALKECA